jgi:ATP-dependent Clp protease ATP-binding subunit ClpA
MFERFTTEARAAVVEAQQVARETGSHSIDTRHLLIVLAEDEGPVHRALGEAGAEARAVSREARAELRAGGLDADALAGLGIDLDAVRRQADAVFGPGALERAGRASRGRTPFTPDAKKALELALREAIRLKRKSIDNALLLLGILRADNPGRAVLRRAGVDTDALRAALEDQTRAA